MRGDRYFELVSATRVLHRTLLSQLHLLKFIQESARCQDSLFFFLFFFLVAVHFLGLFLGW